MIGPPEAIAQAVLSHHPLAVALTILHIEWMTQRHYIESVQDDQDLDPQFKSLLQHHWMEEAQHAKLDTLMVETLAEGAAPRRSTAPWRATSRSAPCSTSGLGQQAAFDVTSLERATGRALAPDQRERVSPSSAAACAGRSSARA